MATAQEVTHDVICGKTTWTRLWLGYEIGALHALIWFCWSILFPKYSVWSIQVHIQLYLGEFLSLGFASQSKTSGQVFWLLCQLKKKWRRTCSWLVRQKSVRLTLRTWVSLNRTSLKCNNGNANPSASQWNLEPVPAVFVWEVGFTLSRSPIYRRVNTETNNHSHSH